MPDLRTFRRPRLFTLPLLLVLSLAGACANETVIDPNQGTEDTRVNFPGSDIVLANADLQSDDLFAPLDIPEGDCQLLAWFADKDDDGIGAKDDSKHSCNQPAGYVASSGDCNDGDLDIFPGNPEFCDGKDNDCNGEIDEGLECDKICTDGQTQPCGMWDTGECEFGTSECVNGNWGPCTGDVGPKPEVCDGLDNDCDGEADDGIDCSCEDGATEECGDSDVGECTLGTMTCVDGLWGECVGAIGPSDEICDELDNDCDGDIDNNCSCPEGETLPCGTNTGLCKAGLQMCVDGQWTDCEGEIGPADESCDGQDNDCDGETDEGCDCLNGDTQPCGTNAGECQAGTMTCTNGIWGGCDGEIAPKDESCDGKDNDCDGQTDEGCDCLVGDTEPCGEDTGECKSGTKTCVNGVWGGCEGSVGPKNEICDGKDNDCDNQVDEVCECQPGDTKPCGQSQGECQQGTQSCVNGSWGVCAGEIGASPEVCDGKDNDCDGKTDEGVQTTYYLDSDKDGYGDDEVATQACKPPAGYKQLSGDCDDSDAAVHPGAAEVCDASDNDCDGKVNEGNVCADCVTSAKSGKKLCIVHSFTIPDQYVQGLEWVPTNGHLYVNALDGVGGVSQTRKVTPAGQVVATYAYPAAFAKDLAFDGQFLWSTAIFPGHIYKFNLQGQAQGDWAMKNDELSSGMAWMGGHFKIIALVALMGSEYHLWTYSGGSSFSNPISGSCVNGQTCFFNGMTQRNGELWHTNASGEIEQRTANWAPIDSFLLQGNLMDAAPIGVAWDGDYLWVSEAGTGNIYKLLYF